MNQKGAVVQLIGCKLLLSVTEEDAACAAVPTPPQIT